MTAVDTGDRVAAQISAAEKRLEQASLRVLTKLRASMSLREIEEGLSRGTLMRQLEPLLREAGAGLGLAIAHERVLASQMIAKLVGQAVGHAVPYAATAPQVVEAIRAYDLKLIREITDEQREAIRAALHAGSFGRAAGPREVARDIKQGLGLTQYQRGVVANYRRQLEEGDAGAIGRALRDKRNDRAIRAAIEAGKPLDPAYVDKLVARYEQSWISYRAETIARTEALRAVHMGERDMYRQAIDRGDLREEELTRTWLHKAIRLFRDFHQTMHHQERAFDAPFLSGRGNRLMFPGDPDAPASETVSCKCHTTTRIDPEAREAPAPPLQITVPVEAPPIPRPPVIQTPVPAPTIITPPPLPAIPEVSTSSLEGKIVTRRPIGGSNVNTTDWVTTDDGTLGVWKPASGEATDGGIDLRAGIETGTFYKREAAAYRVSSVLGVEDMVPETIVRTIDGEVGSVQRAIQGELVDRADNPNITVDQAERQRMFDWITGNTDRHDGNVLFVKGAEGAKDTTHMIDHGLSFPAGAPEFFPQPTRVLNALFENSPKGSGVQPLLPSTLTLLERIDERALIRALVDADMDDKAIQHACYRLRALRRDPMMMAYDRRLLDSEQIAQWESMLFNVSMPPRSDIAEVARLIEEARQ